MGCLVIRPNWGLKFPCGDGASEMPIYEYECKGCRRKFEIFQKISDKPLSNCPECGGKCRRLISQTSFALKGGGWYKDGYSSGNTKMKDEKSKKDGPSSPKVKGESPPPKTEKAKGNGKV